MACPRCGEYGYPGQRVCESCGGGYSWETCESCEYFVDDTDYDAPNFTDYSCKLGVPNVDRCRKACMRYVYTDNDNW